MLIKRLESEANSEPVQFTNGDLLNQLNGLKSPALWLGRYTENNIRHLLEKFDILPALKAKGFSDIIIHIEPLDRFAQALKLFVSAPSPENLLAEFRLREVDFSHPGLVIETPMKMLQIEWLMLQNPRLNFSTSQPGLPGQRHPGLGVAKRILHFLIDLAAAEKLAGILNFPEFFHNAFFYLEYFYFCDPRLKGLVLALRRDLQELSLAELSWAIYLDCVIDVKTAQNYAWQADALVLPLDEKMKASLSSTNYEQIVYETMSAAQFVLNEQKYRKVYLQRTSAS
jgi:hypothetical protein